MDSDKYSYINQQYVAVQQVQKKQKGFGGEVQNIDLVKCFVLPTFRR